MQITDPVVVSFKKMSLEILMNSVEGINGDFIFAYSLNIDGSCSDDVLVLETDVFSDADDEFLDFEGRRFNWEVEIHSLKSVKKYADGPAGSASVETLVDDAKYFLKNRAYRPVSK